MLIFLQPSAHILFINRRKGKLEVGERDGDLVNIERKDRSEIFTIL